MPSPQTPQRLRQIIQMTLLCLCAAWVLMGSGCAPSPTPTPSQSSVVLVSGGHLLTTHKPWASHLQMNCHNGDFCAWKDHDAYQVAFARLLRDLKSQPG